MRLPLRSAALSLLVLLSVSCGGDDGAINFPPAPTNTNTAVSVSYVTVDPSTMRITGNGQGQVRIQIGMKIYASLTANDIAGPFNATLRAQWSNNNSTTSRLDAVGPFNFSAGFDTYYAPITGLSTGNSTIRATYNNSSDTLVVTVVP